jgi:hypothetical protein
MRSACGRKLVRLSPFTRPFIGRNPPPGFAGAGDDLGIADRAVQLPTPGAEAVIPGPFIPHPEAHESVGKSQMIPRIGEYIPERIFRTACHIPASRSKRIDTTPRSTGNRRPPLDSG